jgi:3-hydroxy-3-methylglutaryl CoA synthase
MTTVGIIAAGGYLPRYRLSRAAIVQAGAWYDPSLRALGKSERAVCDWDEDAVTMATEAARHCLGMAGGPVPAGLFLASTTLPFADRQHSAVVASALDLPASLQAVDLTSSQRAGTSALLLALQTAAAGPRLVLAADKRIARTASPHDALFGHGAGAVLVGSEQPMAEYLAGATLTRDFVDHFRRADQSYDYYWEERWIRDEGYLKIVAEAGRAALGQAGLRGDQVDRLVFAAPIRGVREAVAKSLGIPAERLADELTAGAGDTGVAHPLLMLARVLEDATAGQVILLVGFGQGADALVFRTTETVAKRRSPLPVKAQLADGVVEQNYLKFLAFHGGLEVQWGMRAELDAKTAISAAARHDAEFGALQAGKCPKCATLQFPPAKICVNPGCRYVGTQDRVRLAESIAKVASFTEDWLAYTPHPPGMYGMLEFPEGVKMMAQFTSDSAGRTQVGSPMRMVFRIKTVDRARGYVRYFWKGQVVGRRVGQADS